MRVAVLMSVAVLGLSACGQTMATAVPGGSPASVSTDRAERDSGKSRSGEKVRGPRKLDGVPPGHYPREGECRLWHSGRPPGQQPKATSCSSLRGRVPDGAFILYGGKAYDSQYDWTAQARRERGSVPDVIVEIVRSIR